MARIIARHRDTTASSLSGVRRVIHNHATTVAQAGTLPSASRPTMRQSTRRLKPDAAVAASFVVAENTRSVPTATEGGWPKPSTSSGVIKEPPPTPVSPMSRPTDPPHKT